MYNKKIQVTNGILRSMVYHLKRRHGGLTVFYGALVPGASSLASSPGARFSKALETFRARKAIFRSSVSKNGEVYTPETFCLKGTFLHLF